MMICTSKYTLEKFESVDTAGNITSIMAEQSASTIRDIERTIAEQQRLQEKKADALRSKLAAEVTDATKALKADISAQVPKKIKELSDESARLL